MQAASLSTSPQHQPPHTKLQNKKGREQADGHTAGAPYSLPALTDDCCVHSGPVSQLVQGRAFSNCNACILSSKKKCSVFNILSILVPLHMN